jgi:multiple sugar transport system permease protein
VTPAKKPGPPGTGRRRARARFADGLRIVLLVLVLLGSLFPLFWMFAISIKGEGTTIRTLADLIPSKPSLEHYRAIWDAGSFPRYVWNSVLVAAIVVAGNLLFASMVGYALARRAFRGKRWVTLGVFATLMVPKQVTMLPLYLLCARLKLVDTYFALTLPFLVDAFNVFFLTQYFRALPADLEEAARLDGAGDFRIFFRVALPLAAPALAVVGIHTFLVSWNSFLYPLILTNSDRMRTLPVGLALLAQGEHSVDWGHLMAGSAFASIPVLLAFLFFQRFLIEGITQGAGK